jgi:hypothetical protein
LTGSLGMNDSSPTSINCSSSFSITSPRYLTYLSVIIAAALADWLESLDLFLIVL